MSADRVSRHDTSRSSRWFLQRRHSAERERGRYICWYFCSGVVFHCITIQLHGVLLLEQHLQVFILCAGQPELSRGAERKLANKSRR